MFDFSQNQIEQMLKKIFIEYLFLTPLKEVHPEYFVLKYHISVHQTVVLNLDAKI